MEDRTMEKAVAKSNCSKQSKGNGNMKGYIVEMVNAEGKLRFISKTGKDVFSIIEDCEIDFAGFVILNITEFDPMSE